VGTDSVIILTALTARKSSIHVERLAAGRFGSLQLPEPPTSESVPLGTLTSMRAE